MAMAERSIRVAPFDREVEKAIVSLKKGAHLLKCGRRGKPKFRSFRLTTDQKALVWYSGDKEKHLILDIVSKIVRGQKTVNFLRQPFPGKECQSFSLIYQNGERSLDMICKDKEQAETWFLGLTALVYASHHQRHFGYASNFRAIYSCAASPIGNIQRKHNLGSFDEPIRRSEMCSFYGSPSWPLLESYNSENKSFSTAPFTYARQKSLSHVQPVVEKILPCSPKVASDRFMDIRNLELSKKRHTLQTATTISSKGDSPSADIKDVLQDIFMWGEGVGGVLHGKVNAHTTSLVTDALLPKIVESTTTIDAVNISCGERHAALVNKRGLIFCWGEGKNGKLGQKTNMDMPHPKVVDSLAGIFIQSIACGSQHTCAVTKSGELYAWGDSTLGVGFPGDGRNRSQWFPHKICGPLDGINVSKVACGEWHIAIVSNVGQLFTFGDGTFGVLGHGNLLSSSQPKEVKSLKGLKVKSVACGPWHTAAVVETIVGHVRNSCPGGKLFTWGDNDKGRLGHKDVERRLVPTCVESLVDFDFVQVSCGRMFTVALTGTGIVFTMGGSANCQLGNPLAKDNSIATVEGLLKSEFVKEISSGSFHVAVLTTKGKVYTWGKGSSGRLGLGDTKNRSSPALVDALYERHVRSIACGSNFTAAICLPSPISAKEESFCSKCKMSFGFTKKKHNCYNCGDLFCHSCSSNKARYASLAPNKSKEFRVCDLCYLELQKSLDFRPKQNLQSPRLSLVALKTNMDQLLFGPIKIFSPKVATRREANLNQGRITSRDRWEEPKQNLLQTLPPMQRWGQVSCSWQVSTLARENFTAKQSYDDSHAHAQCDEHIPNSSLPRTTSLRRQPREEEKILTEEIRQLYAQAKYLQHHCESKDQKIHLYKQRIEEAWSLATNEAAKFKAAKDFIKVLTKQINAISERISERRPVSNMKSIPNETADLQSFHDFQDEVSDSTKDHMPASHSNHYLCDTATTKTKKMSPDQPLKSTNRSYDDTRQSDLELPEDDRIEEDGPGIYLTLTTSKGTRSSLKRIRFSRKHFTESEAERWWKDNQNRIYLKYGIR